MALRGVDVVVETRRATSVAGAASRTLHSFARRWSNVLFVLPYLAVCSAMLIFPLAAAALLSLQSADLFGAHQYVGLHNFARLLGDEIFIGALHNTLYFVLLTVPALTLVSLLLALLLHRAARWAGILRAIFFAPAILSVTVVTLLWRVVFMPDGGLLPNILAELGWEPIAVLDMEQLALPAMAIATIWWCLGFPMMLFLAALTQVPRDLYEAATLDHAGRWTTFRRITLPAIRRTFAVVVAIEVVLQLQLFGQAQLMTQGGPNNASRPLVMFIYETSFRQWDVGYAAAASQVLFMVILLVVMLQWLLANKHRGQR